MGIVYKARQRSLNRWVALKVLPPGLAADPVALARFRREIAALERCEHPNLVKILTSGSDGDRHYYAMELVEGTNLADLFVVLASWRRQRGRPLCEEHLAAAVSSSSEMVQQQRLLATRADADPTQGDPQPRASERLGPPAPPDLSGGRDLDQRLAELFADAADALAHLHARGVLHRDLKPGNLMLTADGKRLVIMDLGLAQLKDRSQGLTRTGTRWVGTLRYCSPEQLQWNLLDVDERADVYGLGATLYELIALAPLFDADSETRLIEQVLRRDPRDPRIFDPSVPRDLAAIALGCLDKDRGRRYAGARELADDLRRFCAGQPVRVRPASAPQRLWRWCRRNPAVASLTAAVALLLLAGSIVSTYFAVLAGERAKEAVISAGEEKMAREEADDQRRFAEIKRHEAERLAAEVCLERGLTLCEAGESGRGLLWLAHALKIAPPDANDLQRAARTNLTGWSQHVHPLRACLEHDDVVTSAVWAGNGEVIVTGSQDSRARVWDAATGKRLRVLLHPGPVLAVACSLDGKLVVTGCKDSQGRLWSVTSGKLLGKLSSHAAPVRVVAFSPDGSRVATGSEDGTAQLWDARTGIAVGKALDYENEIVCLSFSPDGTKLACGARHTAHLLDAATGLPLGGSKPMEHKDLVAALAFSPDGKWLVTASYDHTAQLWNATTTQCGQTLPHDLRVVAVAFSPDSKKVLTGSWDGTAQLWNAGTGESLLPPLVTGSWVFDVSFSPDGRVLLVTSADGIVRLYDVANGHPIGPPLRHPMSPSAATFDPVEGKTLLTRTAGKVVCLWDRAPGNVPLRPRPRGSAVTSLAYSPDGRFVLAGDGDKEVLLHETATWNIRHRFAHAKRVNRVAWRGDGKRVATAGMDHRALLWNPADGKPCGELPHPAGVHVVAFSPNGQSVLTGCQDGFARIWNEAGAKPLELPHLPEVLTVAWSPDGKTVLTGGTDATARLWDAKTGKQLGPPLGHQVKVNAVAFSRDGKTIATGGWDQTVRLWDARLLAEGKEKPPLTRPLDHRGTIATMEFSKDDRTLVTGGNDRKVRFWDVTTGLPAAPALPHPDWVGAVSLSPDGKFVLTGCRDKHVRLWAMPEFASEKGDVDRVVAGVEARAGLELGQDDVVRVLSPEAWRQRRQALTDQGGLQAP
jgi:WD40 repeat protein/serine/threonine protein kinase